MSINHHAPPVPVSPSLRQPAKGHDFVAAQAAALCEIAQRMEDFLCRQVQRLEQLPTSPGDPGSAAELSQLVAEITQERERWRTQREEELEAIRQDADRLLQAWAQLEEEQRRLLAHESARQVASAHAAPNVARNWPDGLAPGNPAQSPSAAPPTAASPNGAAVPLDQLRRDIQKHMQNRKNW